MLMAISQSFISESAVVKMPSAIFSELFPGNFYNVSLPKSGLKDDGEYEKGGLNPLRIE